jgi:hypothetical protein
MESQNSKSCRSASAADAYRRTTIRAEREAASLASMRVL